MDHLMERLHQALAAERAAYDDEGNEVCDYAAVMAALDKVCATLGDIEGTRDIATIIEAEIEVLDNEHRNYPAYSRMRSYFLEESLQRMRVARDAWPAVLTPDAYAPIAACHRLASRRLGAVPRDQVRDALRQQRAELTEMLCVISSPGPKITASYVQRRRNIDLADRLYAARQHAALGVEPADTILPGCILKIHVAHPDTGEPWEVIEWDGRHFEASIDMLERSGLLWREMEWKFGEHHIPGGGIREDDAEELLYEIERDGFQARAEILERDEMDDLEAQDTQN